MDDDCASRNIDKELQEAAAQARLWGQQLLHSGRSAEEAAALMLNLARHGEIASVPAKDHCVRVALREEAMRLVDAPNLLGQRGTMFTTPEGRIDLANQLAAENHPILSRIEGLRKRLSPNDPEKTISQALQDNITELSKRFDLHARMEAGRAMLLREYHEMAASDPSYNRPDDRQYDDELNRRYEEMKPIIDRNNQQLAERQVDLDRGRDDELHREPGK